MTCHELVDRLDTYLDGRLVASDRSAVDRHLSTCDACRDLVAALTGDGREAGPGLPAGLTEAILARTSGRPCQRARTLLAEYVDGRGADVDRDLIRSHLDHCVECRALASALACLPEDLEAFAEVTPPATFVTEVLAATSVDSSWRAWWTSSMQALLGRRRLAWEAGYVGAVLLWMIFGASWAPLRAAPAQALAFVQQNPVHQVVVGLGDGELWEVTGGRAVDAARELRSSFVVRYDGAAETAVRLPLRLTQLRDALIAFDLFETRNVMKSLGDDLVEMWSRFVTSEERRDEGETDESLRGDRGPGD